MPRPSIIMTGLTKAVMIRTSHRAAIVASLAIVSATTGCSDDAATTNSSTAAIISTRADVSSTAGVAQVPVRCSPALVPALDGVDAKPLVCAAARFLSKEEEVDSSGDYVLLTVSWSIPVSEKLSVAVTSSAPTLDKVFVTGELANAEEITQCAAEPNAGNSAVFVATAATGRCMVRQKVAQGAAGVDLSLDITIADNGHVTASVHAAPAN